MPRFLIDEDLPRSTTRLISSRGFEALDARDCGLRGKSDEEVYQFARQEKAVILTADLGFGNILHFPTRDHPGIVIVHFPNEVSVSELNRQIAAALDNLSEDDFRANLIIIEPGKIRIRKP